MGTRGCVAIKKEKGWWGVYNHMDSYPTALGAKVWRELQRVCLHDFAENLLKFTDWREYLSGGRCKYCGRKGLGQPHSVRGNIFGGDRRGISSLDPEIEENIRRTNYPDPEAKYHEHTLDGGTTVEDTHITSENPDPLFMEWVYVVDPDERTLTILTHQVESRDGEVRSGLEPKLMDNGYWDYGHCACRHVRIAVVNLDGPEPDWNLIKDISRAIPIQENSTMSEKVLERLSYPQEVPDCFICEIPMPEAGDSSELEDEIVGHERCIRKKLKELGADVEAFSIEWKG